MPGFSRNAQGQATLAGCPIEQLLAAAAVQTPAYLYDLDAIEAEGRELVAAFEATERLVAYAVKANSAGSIVRALARAGCGADVVSGAELDLALACGIAPASVVMSGVAKTNDEIDLAVARGICALQLESVEEIERVAARARSLGRRARVSLRLNPGVAADTHHHIATGHDEAKFGIPIAALGAACLAVDRCAPDLALVGLSAHVGSLLMQVDAYLASARVVCDAARAELAKGRSLEFLNFGGGFGIDYGTGPAPRAREFVHAARALLRERGLETLRLVVEPGRSMVGPHGVIAASVIQQKVTSAARWAFIDAAMNDLLRPALYGAHHRIEPIDREPATPLWRVAGPVCESADVFGNHPLGPELPTKVVLRDAGAYGFSMASEYNGRPLPAEVFASAGAVTRVNPSPARAAWIESRLRS